MRKEQLANGEFYHIYNRGVDHRSIFSDRADFERFLLSLQLFNTQDPIGSIYEASFLEKPQFGNRTSKSKKLVDIVAYCLNPNHYHIILQQLIDHGISEFMKRVGGGYTKYFNAKQKRSGVLFQGKFKASLIDSNEYLLHVSAYVNLNNQAHKIKGDYRSSWSEYRDRKFNDPLCQKKIILNQFSSSKEYCAFAESSLQDILERKDRAEELKKLLIE